MKKRFASIFMVLVMVFALLPIATIANSDITVTIDGAPVVFEGQGPVITGGRTLVPVRGVFEVLGFYPTWDRDTRTATLIRHDFEVVLTVGSTTFTTNGESFTLDVSPQIIAGRTLLPLRAVLESIGYTNMDWVPSTRTVVIQTGTSGQQPTFTPTPTTTPAPTPTPDVEVGKIISAPTEARRNEVLTIYFQGIPNTEYNIRIVSVAGNTLTADGLGRAVSNADGVVSWTWLVGGRTGAGVQRVTITGGGKTVMHEILIIID